MLSGDIPVGSVIGGRYRVVRVLGQGGTGIVLEVSHVELGGRLALKLLHGDHSRNPDLVARFENEGRLAASLVSPHIVRVTDMGRTEANEPFLVMEFLQGTDLDQIIERGGRQPVEASILWVLQACVGLAHVHAAGSVHRDIKPSNLFLADDGFGGQIVKVLDFGLAKSVNANQRLTTTGTQYGTPLYMSPEQIMSSKVVDGRVDQHALGLVIYELLVGQSAFSGETPGAVTVAIVTTPAPRISSKQADVPFGLCSVVAKALSKNPDERYASIAEFAAEIAPFGGVDAQRYVDATRRALAGDRSILSFRTSGAFPTAPASAVSAPGLSTVPPHKLSTAGVSSNKSPTVENRGRWKVPVAAGVAGLAVAAIAIGFLRRPATQERGADTPANDAVPPSAALLTPEPIPTSAPTLVAEASSVPVVLPEKSATPIPSTRPGKTPHTTPSSKRSPQAPPVNSMKVDPLSNYHGK